MTITFTPSGFQNQRFELRWPRAQSIPRSAQDSVFALVEPGFWGKLSLMVYCDFHGSINLNFLFHYKWDTLKVVKKLVKLLGGTNVDVIQNMTGLYYGSKYWACEDSVLTVGSNVSSTTRGVNVEGDVEDIVISLISEREFKN